MNRAITSLIFVCTVALYAGAAGGAIPSAFTTGTSFENLDAGLFDPTRDDRGGEFGKKYWTTPKTNGMEVVAYGAGEAYDYAANGTKRNAYFDNEPDEEKGVPGTNAKYLGLDVEDALERCVMPLDDGVISNVTLNGGIYSDTLAKFTTSYSAPAISNADKIAVWLRERTRDDGKTVTNLVITAGYFAGSYDKVVAEDYVLTNAVAAGAWCRLTICTVTNITAKSLWNTPAFTVYVDGKPAAAGAGYAVGKDYREDWLTPEARMLVGERRLFPWLVPGVDDKARSLSRFAFAGKGAADDVLFTTTCPDFAVVDNVFTLQWDNGVKSMTCIVSNATSVVTKAIDAAAMPQRCLDFALGTNHYARVTVTNVVYDAAHEYTNGVWTAKNDCTTNDCTETSGVFIYKGKNANPTGFVASSRDDIIVGEGGCATFAEAKTRCVAEGKRTIVLNTDVVITRGTQSGGYNDNGVFSIGAFKDAATGKIIKDNLILDLNGHTLQGANASGSATIVQTDGTLEIIDSVGSGAVLPPLSGTTIAVKSSRKDKSAETTLIIAAGRYEGEVCVTGRVTKTDCYCATCAIGGGSFTNYNNSTSFYLEQYVTNTSAYFGLDIHNYWSVAAADAYVWSGAGANTKWATAANWRGGKVPGADDLAIFPRRDDAKPWAVDFGGGMAAKRLWLDADVAMSGTNEFSDVTVESGNGRFVGSGTMTFTGVLPGTLTGATGSGEARIGTNWTGTVKISKIASPKLLAGIDSWGIAGSKVEFAGVRGYLSDKANHALPFGLILTDDGETPAWKNETGYTGSTVSFPRLTGGGTFDSPKNLREISQVFQFDDVSEFTGAFRIGGKRLVVGGGAAAVGSKAGSVTFSDAVKVRSGLGWSGVTAHFGDVLGVYGEVGEPLMSYSGSAPSVGHVAVTLYDRTTGEETGTCLLTAADGVITLASGEVTLGGFPLEAADVGASVRAGGELEIPAGSAVSIVGKDVIVNGKIMSSVPAYYKLTKLKTASTKFAVSFDKEVATPSLADFEVSSDAGVVVVTVTNAKPGLWYGLRSVASLAESFDGAMTVWQQAEGDTVMFESDVSDAAGFYQVIMTDGDPYGGAW